ncbi:histidinol dehydrogenase [Cytophagaceae bacterium DM2B3-1]|uniref:Histidinol dehydrogenase n=1 Tax=Xanthocytophaga flava TaxID=3048013 RepID=A0ABT7CPY9_9BACT|nr:histidinol dehydrogenase [Xanthocytophaga flavus]MDJ1495813.1 histidinol dehydrogenase [Xanthocytophaga flavus]
MQFISYPSVSVWPELIIRPVASAADIRQRVVPILDQVRQEGDDALVRFTEQFDKVSLSQLQVSEAEIQEAEQVLSEELKSAIQAARNNITTFHQAQLQQPEPIETMPGVTCWRKSVAIDKVGLYIPGGTAPLFSTVLMLGVPAQIAGCKEVVLCTPANKEGKVHPAILYTAHLVGIHKIFKVGGAQAIGAMAYGTQSVPKVYKIFGPGNQYVTAAKQIVSQEGISIDMPAGPSEVAVYADDTANPAFVAADLLSQAEHGVDSHVFLVSVSEKLIQEAQKQIEEQVKQLPRMAMAAQTLQHSKAILVKDEAEAIELLNQYAAEHLILATDRAEILAPLVTNAGSVFMGHYTPEAAGDYASGTNHTLPTNGYARAYSGVSVDSFVKKITFQQITASGIQQVGPIVEQMAEAEELMAHKNAVSIRLASLI